MDTSTLDDPPLDDGFGEAGDDTAFDPAFARSVAAGVRLEGAGVRLVDA